MNRVLLRTLLGVVAAAAAVLSFAALDELGRLCGFGALSALLPVVIDAGAAAGTVAWLSRTTGRARVFGRALALVLLGGSVAGNALSHGLSAYALTASWWVVVAVSAVPPGVLGAVVHLATLTTQDRTGRPELPVEAPTVGASTAVYPDLDQVDEHGLSRMWETAPPTGDRSPPVDNRVDHQAAGLIASGAGRRRLARELDISEHAARELLDAHRGRNGAVAR